MAPTTNLQYEPPSDEVSTEPNAITGSVPVTAPLKVAVPLDEPPSYPAAVPELLGLLQPARKALVTTPRIRAARCMPFPRAVLATAVKQRSS